MPENEGSLATKQDIADLRNLFSDFAAEAQAREERISAEPQFRKDRIIETLRNIETHLVKEFAIARDANCLATLQMRVTELELKLLRIH